MRPADAIETPWPCPECKGTGHSGNLHDETCSACDGSRRLYIVIRPAPRQVRPIGYGRAPDADRPA
jgi:hypothetical protein